ncbi:hypothetical protein [Marinobacter shengliensis]|uniref:hypothetical protein n=1 Tax=Marinobacter shengliensis TaxID=1389223 RepID=UPI00110986BD|nr:hypothetical protein [Marinobacter shengliensis]
MNAKADASTGASASNRMDGKSLYLMAVTVAVSALTISLPQSPHQEQIDRITAETVTGIHTLRANGNPGEAIEHSDSDDPTRIRLALDDTHGMVTAVISRPGLCPRLVRSVFTTPVPDAGKPFSSVLLNGHRFTPGQALQAAAVKANCIMAGYGEESIEIQFQYPTSS